jgi:hypothetical protein
MKKNNNFQVLSDVVQISRQFQRSIRIDVDLGREDSLQGYICQGTARSVLEGTARQILETKQRAFTWTGPYGGGKSSLALALCSLVYPQSAIRKAAQTVLGLNSDDSIIKAFNPGKKGWLVVPVVGRRSSVIQELYRALKKAITSEYPNKNAAHITSAELLDMLVKEADSGSHSGVLVVIDELGKFLESAVHHGDDIYFYQELAEAASRSRGKLVVIGVLHQAFEQYATKLGRNAREEWAKIQGRYIDIPLVAGSDELVELTGKAINSGLPHPWTKNLCMKVARSIKARRPAVNANFWERLDNCWPLHPVTAALLGPTSKRRFGQNERSTFGFLVSVESKGFMDYLQSTPCSEKSLYLPSTFWDYLRVNLEAAILASPDGHRWAQAAEAVERAEAKGHAVHVQLTKTIALIELFRNGSGLAADDETLCASLPGQPEDHIRTALAELKGWSIIAYRKHLGAWGVFAGSDFDIDSAVNEALVAIGDPDLEQLTKLSNLFPVIAKRHYLQNGTLRWMNVSLCQVSELDLKVQEFEPADGSFGQFILAIPNRDTTIRQLDHRCKAASIKDEKFSVVLGSPKNGEVVRELGRELLAIESVRKQRPELEGDAVARREIAGRMSALKSQLENEIRDAFINAHWYHQGERLANQGEIGLSPLASNLADQVYKDTPYVFSELLNRDNPSGSGAKARKELMYAMLNKNGQPSLGFEGYPAEAGIFHTLLSSTSIYRKDESGKFAFLSPGAVGKGATYSATWKAAEELIFGTGERVNLSDLYQRWTQPPLGIRTGVLPIFMLAFILANNHRVAVYKSGMFVAELQEADIDEILQDPSRFSLRYVQLEKQHREILEGLNSQMQERLGRTSNLDPLDSARVLVSIVYGLPVWTQRTSHLADKTRQIRDILLRASDPHKVLFVDLPLLFEGGQLNNYIEGLGEALSEMSNAYDDMLRKVVTKTLNALDANFEDIESIKRRAKVVSGISGDLRLDGFAARLTVFDDSRAYFENLLGLAINKPSRDWNDQDIDAALIALADFSLRFRQTEVLAAVQDRSPTRQAIAIVFGTGDTGKTVSKTFDISEKEQKRVQTLATAIMTHMNNVSPELFLAALAQAGTQIIDQRKESL